MWHHPPLRRWKRALGFESCQPASDPLSGPGRAPRAHCGGRAFPYEGCCHLPSHHRKAVFSWAPPRGATPTTHIAKLPLSLMGGRQVDFTTSVDNEWLCLRLLKAYGLGVATVHIATFGKQRVLVVERFDRRTAPDGRWLMRLSQEDFCQVEGCSPLRKYENEGGPGLRASFSTLRQSQNAEADTCAPQSAPTNSRSSRASARCLAPARTAC